MANMFHTVRCLLLSEVESVHRQARLKKKKLFCMHCFSPDVQMTCTVAKMQKPLAASTHADFDSYTVCKGRGS